MRRMVVVLGYMAAVHAFLSGVESLITAFGEGTDQGLTWFAFRLVSGTGGVWFAWAIIVTVKYYRRKTRYHDVTPSQYQSFGG